MPGLARPVAGLWFDVEPAGPGSGRSRASLLKSGVASLGSGLGGGSVPAMAGWWLCLVSQGGAGLPRASFGLQLHEQTRSPRKTAPRVCV